jgi:manganese transport protein
LAQLDPRQRVTMAPSFMIVAIGIDATQALVLSQVVLSLILPAPMIALLILARAAMSWVPTRAGLLAMAAATVAAAIVLALNLLLVLQIAGVPLDGFVAAR